METTMNNIALFIDFENVGYRRKLDLRRLMGELQKRGSVSIKRAYADWGRFASQKRQMLECSVELTELPAHGQRGKNSSDIKLVVDAMEVALTKPYLDTFVIVSSDSDFTPLIGKLREHGKRVVVMGIKEDMSHFLRNHCDEVVYLDDAPVASGRASPPALPKAAVAQFRLALALLNEKGSVLRGAQIKSMLRELKPGFDEKTLGFARFRAFAEAAVADSKALRVEDAGGGDFVVSGFTARAGLPDAEAAVASGLAADEARGPSEVERRGVATNSEGAQAVLREQARQALRAGPGSLSDLAKAIKAAHYADDESVSTMGLRGLLQQLVRNGLLAEIELDGRRLVTWPTAAVA
jgi:uncharacterized protein (TIGR00288 family)